VSFSQANFIGTAKLPAEGLKVTTRVRYRQPLAEATLSGTATARIAWFFEKPQKFIAPPGPIRSFGTTQKKNAWRWNYCMI